MLDTIAWDVIYPAPVGLDATWRYVASHADGVLFISEFSRQRFEARFALSPSVRSGVVHLSLDPADYQSGRGRPGAARSVLADRRQRVRPQIRATDRRPGHPRVPREETVAIGDEGPRRGPRVTQLKSGPIR